MNQLKLMLVSVEQPAQAESCSAESEPTPGDPSDPSGNTVFVGAAAGGIWKTSNFLTNSVAGPTYVPLTNFVPTQTAVVNGIVETGSAMNISSIAVFGRNKNPAQTVILQPPATRTS